MSTVFLKLKPIAALMTAAALLAGCSVAPATDSHPANRQYRCDRNGTQEERQAC